MAWTAPVVIGSLASPAAALTCGCTSTAVSILATCQPETAFSPSPRTCRTEAENTVTVCRSRPDQVMRLARNAAGTQRPYFDELAVLTVTSPSSATVIWNIIWWQNDCRNPAGTDVGMTGGNPCTTSGGSAIDVTSMFGSECGLFTVRIQVRNSYSPYAWSTAWIVPA